MRITCLVTCSIVFGFVVSSTRTALADDSAVSRIKTSTNREGQAFHVDSDVWATALHVLDGSSPSGVSLMLPSGNVACSATAADPAHDLALLTCKGTEKVPKLELKPLPPGDRPIASSVAYTTEQFTGYVLQRPIAVSLAEDQFACKAGTGAMILPDVPDPGESGAPLIARYEDGTDAIIGVWLAGWTSGPSSKAKTYGVAVQVVFLEALLAKARTNALPKIEKQKLLHCGPATALPAADQRLARNCLAAAATTGSGAPPTSALKSVCGGSNADELQRTRSAALAEQALFEAVSGPAGWAIVVDSAFGARSSTQLMLTNHSSRLTRLWERVHGDEFASAFEYRVFDAALARLKKVLVDDAALRSQVQAFLHLAAPSDLDHFTAVDLFMRVAGQPLEKTPRWMLCALAGGLTDLNWGHLSGNFGACMNGSVTWAQVFASMTAEFDGQNCDRLYRLAPLKDLQWRDWVQSPRLQVAFWLALEQNGVLDINAAFAAIAADTNELTSSYAQATQRIRATLVQLLPEARHLGADAMRAVRRLQRLVGSDANESPSAFLRRSMCLVSAKQDKQQGIGVEYLKAVGDLTSAVCGAGKANAYCFKPDQPIQRTPSDEAFVQQAMADWLKETKLDEVFDKDRVQVKLEIPADGERFYWLVLRPRIANGFGNTWDKLVADYRVKSKGESLEQRIALAFAMTMNADPQRIAVYVDNYCDDLRIRLLRGWEPFFASVRCKSASYSTAYALSINVDLLAARFVAFRAINVGAAARLRWIEDVMRRYVQSLGGRVVYLNDTSPDAIAANEAEFVISGLRRKVIRNGQLWERLNGMVMLRPQPSATPGEPPTWLLKAMVVNGGWASGHPRHEPQAGYTSMDPKYVDERNAFVDRMLRELEQEALKGP